MGHAKNRNWSSNGISHQFQWGGTADRWRVWPFEVGILIEFFGPKSCKASSNCLELECRNLRLVSYYSQRLIPNEATAWSSDGCPNGRRMIADAQRPTEYQRRSNWMFQLLEIIWDFRRICQIVMFRIVMFGILREPALQSKLRVKCPTKCDSLQIASRPPIFRPNRS